MTVAEFEDWLQRAESNLEIARRARGEKVFLEDLCFEAQQAAEKALKALLIRWVRTQIGQEMWGP
jgi:HEPN domain-containing protein